jgi:hypothetical protein
MSLEKTSVLRSDGGDGNGGVEGRRQMTGEAGGLP